MQFWLRHRTSSPSADGSQQILSAIQQMKSDLTSVEGTVNAQDVFSQCGCLILNDLWKGYYICQQSIVCGQQQYL